MHKRCGLATKVDQTIINLNIFGSMGGLDVDPSLQQMRQRGLDQRLRFNLCLSLDDQFLQKVKARRIAIELQAALTSED